MAYGMSGSKRPLTSVGQRAAPQPMWHRDASQRPPWRSGFPAPYVLPVGFAALLAVGTVTAALGGRLSATGVLVACAVVVVDTTQSRLRFYRYQEPLAASFLLAVLAIIGTQFA